METLVTYASRILLILGLLWHGSTALGQIPKPETAEPANLQILSSDVDVEPVPIPIAEMPPPLEITLDEIVNLALTNSPRLRRAAAEVEKARGEAVQVGMYPNPTFDSGGPQFQLGGAQSLYTTGLTQEIVRGRKLQLSRAAAEQRVAALQMQYAAERLSLVTDVRRQFLATLAGQMRLDLMRHLLQLARNTEKTSENLLQGGETSRTDVLMVRVERRRAESSVEALELSLFGQRRQLAAISGVPEFQFERLVGNLEFSPPALDETDLVQQATFTNPQVLSAQYDVARSRFAVDRAVVEPVPNVTIQGGANYTVNAPHSQALIGAYFAIPVWNRNQGGIRAARGELSGAVAQQNVVRNEVAGKIASALSRYHVAQSRLRNYETGVLPDAAENLNLVRDGYERGQFDILRLLQAQRAFSEAQLGRLEAQQDGADAAAEVVGLLPWESHL